MMLEIDAIYRCFAINRFFTQNNYFSDVFCLHRFKSAVELRVFSQL